MGNAKDRAKKILNMMQSSETAAAESGVAKQRAKRILDSGALDYNGQSASLKKELATALSSTEFDAAKVRPLVESYAAVQFKLFDRNLNNGETAIKPVGENLSNLFKAHGKDFGTLYPDLAENFATGNIEVYAYHNNEEFKNELDEKHRRNATRDAALDVAVAINKQREHERKAEKKERQEKQLQQGLYFRPSDELTAERKAAADASREKIYAEESLYAINTMLDVMAKPDFEEKSKYDFFTTPTVGPTTTGFDQNFIGHNTFEDVVLEDGSTVAINNMGFTEDQYKVYLYLLNTEGEEAAAQFKKGIENTLNSMSAERAYQMLQEMEKGSVLDKVLSAVGQFGYALDSGVEGLGTALKGIGDTFTGSTEYFMPGMSQQLTAKNKEDASTAGKLLLGASEGLPQVLGTAALGAVNPVLGAAFLGATAYGSSYTDAKNSGATQAQAIGMGIASAALEIALERVVGNTIEGFGTSFYGKVGGSLSKTKLGQKLITSFDDFAKVHPKRAVALATVGKIFGNSSSEFVEEYLSETASPMLRNIFLSENNDVTLWSDEQKEAGLIGFLTGGVLEGARAGVTLANLGTDYGVRVETIKAMPDSKVLEEYKKKFGDDAKSADLARAFLIDSERFIASTVAVSEYAKEGLSYSEAIEKAKKQGVDVSGFEEFTKTAYEIGKTGAVSPAGLSEKFTYKGGAYNDINRLIESGEATDYIVDRVLDVDKGVKRNEAVKAVNEAKQRAFAQSLENTSMSDFEKSNAIKEYVLKEQALDRMYTLGAMGIGFDASMGAGLLSEADAYKAYTRGENAGKAQIAAAEKAKAEADAKVFDEAPAAPVMAEDAKAFGDAKFEGEQLDDSSIVLENDLDEYSSAKQKVIDEYENYSNPKISEFVNDVLAGKNTEKGILLNNVSDKAADIIGELTGVDVHGFKTGLEDRIVRHINERHGKNGSADHSMSNLSDLERIQYVIDNFDSIEHSGRSNSYTTIKKNGFPALAQTVTYSKAINGTFYVVEAVPDTKAKTLQIVSAFIETKKKGDDSSHNAEIDQAETSETYSAVQPSKSIISDSSSDVNTVISDMGSYGRTLYNKILEPVAGGAASASELQAARSGFAHVYEAGQKGVPYKRSQAKGLHIKEINAIYEAGKKDAAARVNVKKKTDAKVIKDDNFKKAKVSKRTERILSGVSKIIGRDIRFSDDVKGNARIDLESGEIIISTKAKSGHTWAMIHEVYHALVIDSPAEAEQLKKTVLDIAKKNPEAYDRFRKRYEIEYSSELFDENNKMRADAVEYISEEMVADLVGFTLSEPAILEKLTGQQRNILQKFVDKLVSMFGNADAAAKEEYFSSRFGGEFRAIFKDVAREADSIAEQFKAALDRSKTAKESTVTRDGVRESKAVDLSGKEYWQIDTDKDVFKNLSDTKDLQNAAYNFILKGDKGERVTNIIDGEELQFRRVSATEYLYGTDSKTLDTDSYKQKMRMSPSILDLIENATITYDSPDIKDNKKFPDGFKNYQGRVGIDDKIFRYIVRVGKAKNGKVFYDISLEVDDVKVHRAKGTSLINKSPTSTNNYTQKDGNVNRNSRDIFTKAGEDYMKAVESGDMDTAQRMVDEAAEKAFADSKVRDYNGKLVPVYHGTSKGGHTVFDTYSYHSRFGLFGNGAYFTEDRNIAEQYTKKGKGDKPQVYDAYLNITNPIDMDAKADISLWNKALERADLDYITLSEGMTNEGAFREVTETLADEGYVTYEAEETVRNIFENMGYDGITHIGGGRAGKSDGTRHRVWIAFESEQIKSADPVTQDDNGKVVPLSERFNPDKNDIRWSKELFTDDRTMSAEEIERDEIEQYIQQIKSSDDLSDADVQAIREEITQSRKQQREQLLAEIATTNLARWGAELGRQEESGKVLSINEAIKKVEESFGVKVTSGGDASVAGSNVSSYNESTRTIRTKFRNDLPAVCHALGYHIDKKLGVVDKAIEQTAEVRRQNGDGVGVWEAQLLSLANYDGKDSRKAIKEGFAEFIRMYLVSKNLAQEAAPIFYGEFESILKEDAELQAAVETSAEAVHGYFMQSAGDRGGAAVMTAEDWKQLNKPRGKEAIRTARDWVVVRLFDRFYGIKSAEKEHNVFDLTTSKTAYVKATLSLTARAKAARLLDSGFYDANGNKVGEGFFDIIEGLGAEYTDKFKAFGDYLSFVHALEWIEPNKVAGKKTSSGKDIYNAKAKGKVFADETLNDATELKRLIGNMESKYPDFKGIAERIYKYQDNLMNYYLVPSGALSRDQAEVFKAQYPHYVPFNRFNTVFGEATRSGKGGNNYFGNLKNPIQRADGGNAPIRHPLESIINSTFSAVDFYMKNDTMKAMIEEFTGNGALPGVMERIYSTEELKKLDEKGQNPFVVEKAFDGRKNSEYQENCKTLISMNSVSDLKGDELDGDKAINIKIKELFEKWDNEIVTEQFGNVALTNSSIHSELRHGITRNKITAFAAIREVLKNGVIIDRKTKNRGEVERIVVAAPITISKVPYYMGVMLQKDSSNNRLYLHDVVIKKEASEYQAEHLSTTGPVENENLHMTEILERAISVGNSIPQSFENVNMGVNESTESAYNPVIDKEKGIVYAWVNGEKRFYQIYDRGVYNAVANLEVQNLRSFWKFFNSITNVLKVTMTMRNPLFAPGNFYRDFNTFHYNTTSNANILMQLGMYAGALRSITKNDTSYQLYKALGGGDMGKYTADIDAIKKTVAQRNSKAIKWNQMTARDFGQKVIKNVGGLKFLWDKYFELNDVFETLPRLAEFKYTMKKTGGDTQLAFYRSQDVTTNFSRSGSWGRNLNAIFLFSNAELQGIDKMVRNYTEAEYQGEDKAGNPNKSIIAGKILKTVGWSFFMTALSQFINRRDDEAEEEYARLSEFIKNNYDVFYIGNGYFAKVPKEQNLAIPRTSMQRIFDAIKGDDVDFRELGSYIWEGITPGFVPDIFDIKNVPHQIANNTPISVFTDVMANRDFKGAEIVPSYLDGPEYLKYNNYTSALSVNLAKGLYEAIGYDISPMALDHYMSAFGYYGTLFTDLMPYVDVEEKGVVGAIKDNWFNALGVKNKFSVDARYSTDLLNDFYDRRDRAEARLGIDGSGENRLVNEKYKVLGSFISNYNKQSRTGGEEQQRLDRKMLQVILEGFDEGNFSEGEQYVMKLYEATGNEAVFVSSFPGPELRETKTKKGKKIVTTAILDANVYAEYCNEISRMREAVRILIRDLGLDETDAAELLAKEYSNINADVKAKYLSLYGKTEETAAEKKEKKFDEKAYEKAYEDALNNEIYGD